MIAIIDYGVGNLFSLQSSLRFIKADVVVTSDAAEIQKAEKILLPGVGAFGDAMAKLQDSGLAAVVKKEAQKGKPLLGICLGMQLLFSESHEFGVHPGLDLISGKVIAMKETFTQQKIALKVPQIVWNELVFAQESPLLKYVKQGDFVYYVHSYYASECDKSIAAFSDYGVKIPGLVQKGNIFGTQFHPEKSGEVGLNILRAFTEV
ncbi:imidazole glycerol phosphate synthase subunit HisH [uncultured Enterococcus sp.]|uniref:imidazole glycerol phosphate synthase subunit HisH n=1 Tax=uncultured Enterococcus sp. TaxID=167972 RepID=UPI0028060723|nr:imidazole glycerol phosphate synthase subunit HisH [uncultured Enterococcus sp.]